MTNDDLPVLPNDPRWRPARRSWVLLGLGVQLFFALVAWSIVVSTDRRVGPLVQEVLIPEDVVFYDSELPAVQGRRSQPVSLAEVTQPTAARLEQGRTLFAQHCASCHGPGGRGDGPAASALQPRPRDLTRGEGWQRGRRLSALFRTVSGGLPGTQMPAFDYLAAAERFAVAHYAASLAGAGPQDTRASLDSLEAEFSLSEGAREPNVVPLSRAMERLAAEGAAPGPSGLADAARADSLEPRGARLFAELVVPGQVERAARLLHGDPSWRGSVEQLRLLATSNRSTSSFQPRAALLSAADWKALHRYLTLRFEAQE